MKKNILLFLLFSIVAFSQEKNTTSAIEVNFFKGNVLPHTPDLYHLQGHPKGVFLAYNIQTHGDKEWQQRYNFPDFGVFFLYQDFKNQFLGHNFSVGAQYNFYFLNRHLKLKLAQGIAYASSPYDKETNSKNKAFGSQILANTNIGLSYKKDYLIDNFGIEAGLLFTHYSNGRIKSPNSGINTYGFNVGVNYNFQEPKERVIDSTYLNTKFREPIKYNIVLRSGVNESPVINSGQHPFYHFGFYADKRLSRKSAFQVGTDLFLTESFKDFIKFKANAYPENNINGNADYKRVGVFVGHELFINKISLEAQVGYYVYDEFKNEIAIYDRVGMKYYLSKKVFTSFTIKTHIFLAEALEFGVGVRL